MSARVVPAKVAVVLTTHAPITDVTAAVHMAATKRRSFRDRRLRHLKTPGIGGFWTVHLLDPGDARRLDTDHEPAMALLIDAGGALHIHALFYAENEDIRVSFIAINHDVKGLLQITSAFWWADAIATRTAEFLAESGVHCDLETRTMPSE